MSEQAKTARAAMKAKAHRLAGKTDPHQKVDASSWTPSEPEAATSQTGMRPVSPRQYKRGGKVVGKHEGEHAKHHAGRKPRKSGGRASSDTSPFTSARHGEAAKGRHVEPETMG